MAKKDRPSVKIDDLMKRQLDAFRKRFGRDPCSNEPLFFDPDHDGPDPIPLTEGKLTGDTLKAMREASVPPQIIYAYKRTGLLLMEELKDQYPPNTVAEWNAAIDEYFDGQADNGTSKFEKYARWDEYAFEGETLGEVMIKIAGAEVMRPIKIVWRHTPDWEQYDEKHQELIPDDGAYEGLNFKAQVRADPMDSVFEKDASDPKNAPCWDRIGLVEDGILGRTVENAIEADIKRQCKEMDQKLRKKYSRA